MPGTKTARKEERGREGGETASARGREEGRKGGREECKEGGWNRGRKGGRDETKGEGGKIEGKPLRLPMMAHSTTVSSRISYYFT